jgi:exo-1,4-beta-D-glucosaminidase
MKIYIKIILSILIITGSTNLIAQESSPSTGKDIILSKWHLKSTILEKTSGEELSKGKYNHDKWYAVDVPVTVLDGFIKNGVYPNPRIDMNNYMIPDISDEFNAQNNLAKYSYLPNHENPWKSPYWFRTEFTVPQKYHGKQVWLNFNGINYRAELWVNGKKIVDSVDMAGMFQRFKYNITGAVNEKGTNYIALKIYPVDHPGTPKTQFKVFGDQRGAVRDLFKDVTMKLTGGWDCALPVRDRNMGIYQDVYINFTDAVDIINPFIVTDLPLPDTTLANLSISATLTNASGKKQTGFLKGKIDLLTKLDMGSYIKKLPGKMNSITFEKAVEVPANGSVTVTLTEKDFAQLSIKNPYLWWPAGYGEQYLHNLELTYVTGGKVSVKKNTTFGIRKVTSYVKEISGSYGMVFNINGKRVFCKGGWIQPDMLLDMSRERIFNEARLLANANLNMIASEDMPSAPEDFVDACDKYGLMWWEDFYQCGVMAPGYDNAYYPLDHYLAIKNEKDIILRYRNSASLVVWCAANETVPCADLYLSMKNDLKELDNTRPFIPSSNVGYDWERLTPYIKDEMPLGVTDNGKPGYTWHPVSYFFDVVNEVNLQMFRDELGVPSVPTLSSLKKTIFNPGKDKNNPIFPLDSVWAEHGTWDLAGYAYKAYDDAVRNVYGFNTKNIEDYVHTAQMVNADSYRAMFEAANSRMWDITSGVMLWKLNSSFPDIMWNIYDWFLNPHAGYYYAKKACEPLHIQLNANDYQVSVINTYHMAFSNVKVRVRVYDFDLKLKWEREEGLNLPEDCYQEVFQVPQQNDITPVYFVRLQLMDKTGKILSDNYYWESSKKSTDFSPLSGLKEVKADLTYKTEVTNEEYHIQVKLKNTSDKLSFMNRLAVVKKDNSEEILPTFWEDNFITLFPGEEKTVEAKISKKGLKENSFTVVVDSNK